MSDTVGAHNELHSEQGALPGRTLRPGAQSGHQGGRHRLAGVREAGPGPCRGVRPRLRLHDRPAHTRRAAAARRRRRSAVRAAAPRRSVAVRRDWRFGPPTRSTCCGWPRPPARPEATAGVPRRHLASTSSIRAACRSASSRACTSCPSCRTQRPHVLNVGHELQPHQRDPTPAPGARQGAATGTRRAADHQVHRGAELVPGQPRDDRQRLPVLPGPARPRADDELHPLRPRLDPSRPPHPGAGAGTGRTATCTPPIRCATSMRWPQAVNTCESVAISGPGASAATSRAARSSTTGAIPTASWSSTSPTATCSTTPSNPAGRRSPLPGLAQWGPPVTKDFLGINPAALPHEALLDRQRTAAMTTNSPSPACAA